MNKSYQQDSANTNYYGKQELEHTERFLKNYNKFIVRNIQKHIKENDVVLEFGAGIGTLSDILIKDFKVIPSLVEIDDLFIKILKDKGYTVFNSIEQVNGFYNFIYSSNVLEHIEDDISSLIEIKKKLVKGGQLALYLPAFNNLYSELDSSVGHYRRYEKNEIIIKLTEAGFLVKSFHYCDSLGYFAALALKIFGFNSEAGLGSPLSLKIYDKLIFPLSQFLDFLGFRFLFGKNLFILAEVIKK